jgi:hypothetical protein
MTCSGCGNPDAHNIRIRMRGRKMIERCDARDCGDVKVRRESRTGFAFKDGNGNIKLLRKNSNLNLAKQVRQDYAGDNSDEIRGRDT